MRSLSTCKTQFFLVLIISLVGIVLEFILNTISFKKNTTYLI
jgi:hypothetical protein